MNRLARCLFSSTRLTSFELRAQVSLFVNNTSVVPGVVGCGKSQSWISEGGLCRSESRGRLRLGHVLTDKS